jgi:hypothetical protein
MRESNTLRFAVGSPENIQSYVWRTWVQGNDVYLGARETLFALKVSLHQSNIWRIAWVKELEGKDKDTDRVIFKWQRPGEFAPGWTPSIGILVSSIGAERPFKTTRVDDERIQWLPAALEGRRLLFKVLFSTPGYSEDDLKGVTIPGDRFVGRLVKRDGEIVWVVLREDDLSAVELGKIRDVMEKVKIHLRPGSSEDSISHSTRALLVIADDVPGVSNQPTIFDISLGRENLDIAVS